MNSRKRGWLRFCGRAFVLVLPVSLLSAMGCPFAPPGGGGVPPGYTDADATRGGALYDTWWVLTPFGAPTMDHQLWATRPDPDSNSRTGADTWRCKECHGWDYKGVDGAYGLGSHRTGFPGIFGTTMSPQELYDLLLDAEGHIYDLGAADLWDLVKFVLEGQIDTDDILDGAAFIGSADAGEVIYGSTCAGCHGVDGLSVPLGGDPGFDTFVGAVAGEDPWKFQHKVRFGQPATIMPPQAETLTTAQVGDLGAYAQTLPPGPVVERTCAGSD